MRLQSALIGLGLAVSLGACGDDAPPAATAVQPAQAKTKGKAKVAEAPAAAPIVSLVPYVYNPVGKRDPFRGPVLGFSGGTAEGTTAVLCTEPLCNYDLNSLRVVAVVSGDANPLAMVEDGKGVGYLVRRNTKIGRQGGRVTQVLRDCIVVTSFISGPDGKAQPNKESMCLTSDSKSAPVLDLLGGKDF